MRLLPGPLRRRSRGPSSWRGAAQLLTGPLYAADGAGPAYVAGHGYSGQPRRGHVSVTVRHARGGADLDIETSDRTPRGERPDEWLLSTRWVHTVLRPGRIAFPLVLSADRWEREVAVDGAPVPFLFVGGDDRWAAAGRPGGREVTLTATGWPHAGLALRSVQLREILDAVPLEA